MRREGQLSEFYFSLLLPGCLGPRYLGPTPKSPALNARASVSSLLPGALSPTPLCPHY